MEFEFNEPPELPVMKSAGFDFQLPTEGGAVTLRRLDAPAPVAIYYRSKTYAGIVEAIAFFLAFFMGVRLIGRPLSARFTYAMGVGVGALIVAGAIAPRAAGMWTAVYLGVLFAIFVWLAWGGWKRAQTLPGKLFRRKKAPAPEPPTTGPVEPPAAPTSPTPGE